jgi:hypothetical protein
MFVHIYESDIRILGIMVDQGKCLRRSLFCIFSETPETRGVFTVALPFTLKSILRQKKNYGNSNISPCKNMVFKKSSKTNQAPSRCYNSLTNLKFQHKPKYHLSKILL